MTIIICKSNKYKDIELMEGDMYIIHKPKNTNETPTWINMMDEFDGMTIELVHLNGETKERIYWMARPIDDNCRDTSCLFNMNWLELIGRKEELESSYVDFFDI